MVWWQVILFPLAILYDGITRFRNHLFNIESTPSFDYEANVINVGNLAVGGTGKTPMVIFLVDHFLQEGKRIAILSRGYGRSTRGLRYATENDTPLTVGDEPYMYWRRFGAKQVKVVVAEERAWAIPWILAEQPENDVIILDDAYQHRSVKPSVNLLLTTWSRPFFRDFVLPAGRLRERRSNAQRADLMIVTKSPADIRPQVQDQYVSTMAAYGSAPVLFATVDYQEPIPFNTHHTERPKEFVAVSGLASNSSFRTWASSRFQIAKFIAYGDHHRYVEREVRALAALLSPDVGLLTTEKDAVKLQQFKILQEFPCFFVPIEVRFLHGEERLWETIQTSWVDYNRELPEDRKDS